MLVGTGLLQLVFVWLTVRASIRRQKLAGGLLGVPHSIPVTCTSGLRIWVSWSCCGQCFTRSGRASVNGGSALIGITLGLSTVAPEPAAAPHDRAKVAWITRDRGGVARNVVVGGHLAAVDGRAVHDLSGVYAMGAVPVQGHADDDLLALGIYRLMRALLRVSLGCLSDRACGKRLNALRSGLFRRFGLPRAGIRTRTCG